MEDAWTEIQRYLSEVFRWAGVEGLEAEELSVVPGLDEVFALADIKQHAESGEWDVVVVDCAPTAETVRLLSLPDVLGRYMERLFPMGRTVNRVVAPVLSRVTNLPVADDSVFAATRRFYDRLDGVREILTDGTRSSVRLVVNAERVVIAEARRTYTYLSLFGYHVDAVVANRLLPEGVDDPFFAPWKTVQKEHLATIDEGFAPLPVLRVPWQPAEPVGLDPLRAVAGVLYGGDDPTARLADGRPLRARPSGDNDGGYVLEIDLPFTGKDELEVGRRADELLVRVGPYRRAITLPDSLCRRAITGARLDDGLLAVTFGPPG
jgi:arsenite-transporting ATPase